AAPHCAQHVLAGHDAVPILQEIKQDVEYLALERHAPAGARELAPLTIESIGPKPEDHPSLPRHGRREGFRTFSTKIKTISRSSALARSKLVRLPHRIVRSIHAHCCFSSDRPDAKHARSRFGDCAKHRAAFDGEGANRSAAAAGDLRHERGRDGCYVGLYP